MILQHSLRGMIDLCKTGDEGMENLLKREEQNCLFSGSDALRFYGGDTRERCSNGYLGKKYSDPMYGDEEAYRTLNALLFEGSENEKERIWIENHKLNPQFIRRIDETVNIYMNIFTLMKKSRANDKAMIGKRVDRASSVIYYEAGFTQSFFSCSKGDYDDTFSKKNNIVLIEVEVTSNVPFVDYENVLAKSEYKYLDEREILLPPFLKIKLEEANLTPAETRRIKDQNGKLPLRKYRLQTIEFPNYCKIISESEDEVWKKIIDEKENAACLLEKMNQNDKDQDYREYERWKNNLQTYLKLKFSDIWYEGKEY